MSEQLSATVIGLDKLQANLKDLTGPPLAKLLGAASGHAKRTASEGLGGGVASRSIQSEIKPGSARVYSLMSPARSTSIELGRPENGPLLHPGALRRWIAHVGYPDSPYVLAKHIQRRGVKGRFFMRQAIQSTQNALPGLLNDMAKGVERRFGRR